MEQDVLQGRGKYVPTAPEFAGVHFLTLAARMERVGGIPDIQLGALRLIRTLDVEPDLLWLMVRAYSPMIQKFGVVRHVLYSKGELPLPRGEVLTQRQEDVLGFPRLKPGDLERAKRESDLMHARLQSALGEEQSKNSPRC